MTSYRIVKRAFSNYTTVETFTGTRLAAGNRATDLQFAKRDGEYLVREIDEPNQRFSGYGQSPMDWL